jgi:hypothetical protein
MGKSVKVGGLAADPLCMGKSVIGFSAAFGTVAGGYVPVLWGASSFSLVSLLFGVMGGIAGVWFGVRVSDA